MRSSSGSAHRCRQRGWRGTEGLWHRVFINYGTTLNLTNQAGGLTDIPWGTVVQVNGSFNDVRRGNSALANLSSIEGQLMIGNGQVTTIQPAGGELDINGLYYNYGCNYSACLDVSYGSTVNIVGDVYNWGGEISTGAQGGGGNVLNISGRLYSDGQITLGSYGNTGDVLNTGSLENRGSAYIDFGSTLNVAGDLINAGLLQTGNQGVGGNAITVGGTLVNSGTLFLNEPGDVVNAGQLMIAAGSQIYIGNGATLNLTNQLGGIIDIPNGAAVTVNGLFNDVAGNTSAIASLGHIEGGLNLGNGQVTTITPPSGTLYIEDLNINSGCGYFIGFGCLDVSNESTVNINGDVYTSPQATLSTSSLGIGGNTLNISGQLTNYGNLILCGSYDGVNVGAVMNNGQVNIVGNNDVLRISGGWTISTASLSLAGKAASASRAT